MGAYVNACRTEGVDRVRVVRNVIAAIEPHEVSQQLIGHGNHDLDLVVARKQESGIHRQNDGFP